MRIRPELEADRARIHAVNVAAFATTIEADLVESLHAKDLELISLIAEIDDAVVGHILFSPVALASHPHLKLMGLGPLAVEPQHQRRGIGSALVQEGLSRCEALGCQGVVVVGHPEYYPRFGFVPARELGFRCEYDVPDNAFMIKELEPGALRGATGLIRYSECFARTSG
jgi:putative acetyltransferase